MDPMIKNSEGWFVTDYASGNPAKPLTNLILEVYIFPMLHIEINPAEHPLTSPAAKITELPAETFYKSSSYFNTSVGSQNPPSQSVVKSTGKTGSMLGSAGAEAAGGWSSLVSSIIGNQLHKKYASLLEEQKLTVPKGIQQAESYYRQLRIDPLPPESADALLEALARTSNINIEFIHFSFGQMLLKEVREFQRVHAADPRAVLIPHRLVPGSYALDKNNTLGFLAIGGSQYLSSGGP
jgi:hypothetical protein